MAQALREGTGVSHALAVLIEVDDGRASSILAAAFISRSPRMRAPNLAARAFMAAATGSASAPSSSASTACAVTCRISRSPSAPISNEFKGFAPSAYCSGS